MQDQTIISQLLQQNKLLMEMMCTMQHEITDLKSMMVKSLEQQKPVNKFFNNIQKKPAPTKLSKAEKEALDDEAMQAAIIAKALKKQSKKGLI